MDNLIIFIAGKKGSGKTSFAKKSVLPAFSRLLVIDSLSEYENGFIVNSIPDFINVVEANYNKPFFTIIYRPLDEKEAKFFEIVKELHDVSIVIEEADMYSNPYKQDKNFERLVRYGRHFSQDLIVISRRPAEISRNVTAQADIVLTFQQTERRDIDYFKYYTDQAENLSKLKQSNGRNHEKHTHYEIVLGESLFTKKIANKT